MEKKPCWMWRAIDGVSRKSIGYHLGNRSDADLKKLVRKVDNGKCLFVTDDWAILQFFTQSLVSGQVKRFVNLAQEDYIFHKDFFTNQLRV